MGSRSKDSKGIRPTPPPSGPALVRPAVGVLLVALGSVGAGGCKTMPDAQPPVLPPMPEEPMAMPMEDPPPMPQPREESSADESSADESSADESSADEPPESKPPMAPMPDPGPNPG